MRPKIVEKKKLIGFSEAALAALERRKKNTGRSQTEIINDLVLGQDRFHPYVERAIARRQAEKQLSREEAVNELLAESIAIQEATIARALHEPLGRISPDAALLLNEQAAPPTSNKAAPGRSSANPKARPPAGKKQHPNKT